MKAPRLFAVLAAAAPFAGSALGWALFRWCAWLADQGPRADNAAGAIGAYLGVFAGLVAAGRILFEVSDE